MSLAERQVIVHAILCEQERLNELHQKINQLEESLARNRYLIAPIHSVPPEILSDIFLYLGPVQLPEDLHVLNCLMLVSKSWRNTVFGTAALWSIYCLGRSRYTESFRPILRKWFERSQEHPLTLDISLSPDNQPYLRSHDYQHILSRVSHFELNGLAENRTEVLGWLLCLSGSSQLKVLRFECKIYDDEDDLPPHPLVQFPRIQQAAFWVDWLNYFALPLHCPPTLTHLELAATDSAIANVLTYLPSHLQNVKLTVLGSHDRVTSVQINDLRHLHIVYLKPIQATNIWTACGASLLSGSSGVQTLYLEYDGHIGDSYKGTFLLDIPPFDRLILTSLVEFTVQFGLPKYQADQYGHFPTCLRTMPNLRRLRLHFTSKEVHWPSGFFKAYHILDALVPCSDGSEDLACPSLVEIVLNDTPALPLNLCLIEPLLTVLWPRSSTFLSKERPLNLTRAICRVTINWVRDNGNDILDPPNVDIKGLTWEDLKAFFHSECSEHERHPDDDKEAPTSVGGI